MACALCKSVCSGPYERADRRSGADAGRLPLIVSSSKVRPTRSTRSADSRVFDYEAAGVAGLALIFLRLLFHRRLADGFGYVNQRQGSKKSPRPLPLSLRREPRESRAICARCIQNLSSITTTTTTATEVFAARHLRARLKRLSRAGRTPASSRTEERLYSVRAGPRRGARDADRGETLTSVPCRVVRPERRRRRYRARLNRDEGGGGGGCARYISTRYVFPLPRD